MLVSGQDDLSSVRILEKQHSVSNVIGTRNAFFMLGTRLCLICQAACFHNHFACRSWAAMEKTSGTPGASKYLREIADWHEIARSNRVASAAVGMELSMRTCVTRVQLPEVQVRCSCSCGTTNSYACRQPQSTEPCEEFGH